MTQDVDSPRSILNDLGQTTEKGKISHEEHLELNKKRDEQFEKVKDNMAKQIQGLDSRWLKDDTLKSMRGRNPSDPAIKDIERMDPENFKEELIKSLEKFDADTFLKGVDKERQTMGLNSLVHPAQKGKTEDIEAKIPQQKVPNYGFEPKIKINLEEVKKRLTDQQLLITQYSSSEYPGTGKYMYHFEKGKYKCIVCDENLFTSATKYISKKGYAAFNAKLGDIVELEYGTNTSARCENCGSNIGDVVRDDPDSVTGKSYLVNSDSVVFESGYEFID